MEDIRYEIQIADSIMVEGVQSFMFKQVYIGTEEEFEELKGIVDSLRKQHKKARIFDFKTFQEVYTNYTSLAYSIV